MCPSTADLFFLGDADVACYHTVAAQFWICMSNIVGEQGKPIILYLNEVSFYANVLSIIKSAAKNNMCSVMDISYEID